MDSATRLRGKEYIIVHARTRIVVWSATDVLLAPIGSNVALVVELVTPQLQSAPPGRPQTPTTPDLRREALLLLLAIPSLSYLSSSLHCSKKSGSKK